MARTLLQLAQEVSKRRGDLVFSTPTAGTQTTLVDQRLLAYFPQDITGFYPWVYGTATGTNAVAAANQGFEWRANGWTASNYTLALPAPGFPGAIGSTGVYEIRRFHPRQRVVEAINDGIGRIGMVWPRIVKDESLTSITNQWKYTLPAAQNWDRVVKVEMQIATDATLVGYPFADATGLNWRAERVVDASGVETWALQFGTLPPPSRTLRVWGEAYDVDLVAETDILPTSGSWERSALGWVYDWSLYLLDEWQEQKAFTDDFQKAMYRRKEHLERSLQNLLQFAPERKNNRVVVPGRGTGTYEGLGEDPYYLGALRSGGIASNPFNPVV